MTNITRGSRLGAFLNTIVPPVIGRYLPKLLRGARANPAVRVLLVGFIILLLAFLLIPAGFAFLLVWLVTQDASAASAVSLVMLGISATGLAVIIWRLWSRWRRFRRQHFNHY